MNDLISIIVPIYNVKNYIEKCVNSLISQTYKNIEILLIDDGSTDDSPILCDKLKEKDSRIYVYHKKNGGLSDARNYGIERAKGKYLSFIDGDDYIDEDMIEFLYSELKENNCDISICGKYLNYENGTQIDVNNSKEKIIMDKKQALIYINSFKGFDMSACDKLYKKDLFNDISFPYGKKCEDFYTMYKLFDKCDNKIVYNAVSKYHYYQRNDSISRNSTIDHSYVDASLSQLDFFMQKYPELLFAAQTMNVFANLSLYNKYLKYNIKCSKKEVKEIRKVVKKNILVILKNKYIPNYKKIQAVCFFIFPKLYNAIIKKKNNNYQ